MSSRPWDNAIALSIFERMALIRKNDERFIAVLKSGKLTMPYYSARGQECIPAAISEHLDSSDYLVTIYRGIHDMLAKGVPPKVIWAELAGRVTGACKGKGGPMHVTYPEAGCMVTTGIVGAGLPIACGLAWASQLRKEKRVTICNFGDGASNIGAFHESLNLAAIWKLPVVFVCQNNRYGEHTAYAKSTAVARIADRAAAYGMPALHVDGNSPQSVYAAAGEAIARAREGGGPTLIEAVTFRFNGHLIGDTGEYIPKAEYQAALAADPYPAFRKQLIEAGIASAAQVEELEARIAKEVDAAVEFAFSSPLTGLDELERDVVAAAEEVNV